MAVHEHLNTVKTDARNHGVYSLRDDEWSPTTKHLRRDGPTSLYAQSWLDMVLQMIQTWCIFLTRRNCRETGTVYDTSGTDEGRLEENALHFGLLSLSPSYVVLQSTQKKKKKKKKYHMVPIR
uniref:Uncharacterized protein n=2 Tax=Physcomitrium patens TaxID=3218 RepID=A0A2K1J462_PHYPA|nr:hypothetical protein PHYPA_022163 [Physcomitrium patens]